MFSKLSRKQYFIALSAILVLSMAGFAYYKMFYLPSQTSAAASLSLQNTQTAAVQQGDITIYARGSGTLIALNEVKLGFGTSGPIAEINVKIGDKVQKGDVLAVQSGREQFDAAVAADQLSVLTAKQALGTLYDEANIVSSQAQTDLANAETSLQKAVYLWRSKQVRNASSRWKQYQAVSPAFFVTAVSELESAWKDLVVARANYAKYSYLSDDNSQRILAQTNISESQQNFDSALRQLLDAYPPEIQQSQIDIALTMAAARVVQAERGWGHVKGGPDPDKIAIAEQTLTSAEANLAVSQSKLDQSIIVAPMDGTILSVTARTGDDVSAPFITMADLSKRYLQISLDGTDIGKIDVGYEVEVVFDALPNQVFMGKVVQIDPNLYDPSGKQLSAQTPGQTTLVKALVSLDENTATAIDSLPLGMTAAVDINGGQAKGVLLVPVEALHEQAPGRFAVFVLENGEQILRPVEIGLMDFSFAEVKSGLKVGEVVILGPVNTK